MIETTDLKEEEKTINSILYSNDAIFEDNSASTKEIPKEDNKAPLNTDIQEIPEEDNSQENTTLGESTNIEIEDANTTNCLALTIQKDHKLVAVKNVVIRSIRMTWKVAVSTIALTILKLFS